MIGAAIALGLAVGLGMVAFMRALEWEKPCAHPSTVGKISCEKYVAWTCEHCGERWVEALPSPERQRELLREIGLGTK
jgi:hypothetical protein